MDRKGLLTIIKESAFAQVDLIKKLSGVTKVYSRRDKKIGGRYYLYCNDEYVGPTDDVMRV